MYHTHVHTKHIHTHTHLQPRDETPPRSSSPIVRDPRKRQRERDVSEEKEMKKRRKEKSAEPDTSTTSEVTRSYERDYNVTGVGIQCTLYTVYTSTGA